MTSSPWSMATTSTSPASGCSTPALEGKPVVVLSNNDGCVVARSSRGEGAGRQDGARPGSRCRPCAKKHGIIALSTNYTLYADMSNRMMRCCWQLLAASGDLLHRRMLSRPGRLPATSSPPYGQPMRQQVRQWTGHAGLRRHRPHQDPRQARQPRRQEERPGGNGVCDLGRLYPSRDLTALLALSMSARSGASAAASRRETRRPEYPHRAGLEAGRPWPDPAPILGGTGKDRDGAAWRVLPGAGEFAPAKQQIMCSRSFGAYVLALAELREAVTGYTTRAAEKLRRQHRWRVRCMCIIRTNPFTGRAAIQRGITIPLPDATSDTLQLDKAALWGLSASTGPDIATKGGRDADGLAR